MQDVDAGMKAIDDHMPAAYDRMHSACILHGSLMWPRLKCKLSSEAKPFLLPYSKYTQDFTPRHWIPYTFENIHLPNGSHLLTF